MQCTDAPTGKDARARRSLLLRALATAGAVAATGAVAAGGSTLASIRAGDSSIRDNPFRRGSVMLVRSGRGAIFSFRNVAIGARLTRRVTVANGGTRAGRLVLSARVRSTALSRRLRLTISAGGRPLYHGPLAGFRHVRAGTIEPGGALTFVLRLDLRSTGSTARDDAVQDEAVDASFSWSAVAA